MPATKTLPQVATLDPAELLRGDWAEDALAIVVPGGADLPYCKARPPRPGSPGAFLAPSGIARQPPCAAASAADALSPRRHAGPQRRRVRPHPPFRRGRRRLPRAFLSLAKPTPARHPSCQHLSLFPQPAARPLSKHDEYPSRVNDTTRDSAPGPTSRAAYANSSGATRRSRRAAPAATRPRTRPHPPAPPWAAQVSRCPLACPRTGGGSAGAGVFPGGCGGGRAPWLPLLVPGAEAAR